MLAHLALAMPLPIYWRGVAALVITALVPGALLVEWLVGGVPAAAPDPWERSLYSMGAGAVVTVLVMLALAYLPIPIHGWLALLAFDSLSLLLAGAILLRRPPDDPSEGRSPSWREAPRGWLMLALASLLLTGGLLRLNGLGYSEFQGDEARVVLRTAATLEDIDALLSHMKGPGEILLPAAVYAIVGRIDEQTARLPFSLLNLTGLFAVFLLGWRLFGPVAGWSAAMVLALDGYFVGFGRIVQYQSIVFCLAVLTVLVLHRLMRSPRLLTNYLTLAALFLGVGLLAHYGAALVALPAGYLLWRVWRKGTGLVQVARAMIIPIATGTVILAVFYIPFVLHPNFSATYGYIADDRIGADFPYNNLRDFFVRTTVYSTTYYLLLMIAAAVTGLALIYIRNLPRWAMWTCSALLVGGVGLTLARPEWLMIAGHDHTWLFFATALVLAWSLPRFRPEERTVWLWFGAGMLLMLFFTRTPNTHVYGFIIPWALVAGSVADTGYTALAAQIGDRWARWAGTVVAAVLTLVFGLYAFWYFAAVNLEAHRTWHENRLPGYWVNYDVPTSASIFGFPLQNGWKVASVLYADGVLDAPYDMVGKEVIASWYMRAKAYCPRDHRYLFWSHTVEPSKRAGDLAARAAIENRGYRLFGEATVNGQPRLAIYTLGDAPETPWRFPVEEYAPRFDRDLSGSSFRGDGPLDTTQPEKTVDLRFGDEIRLTGYTLHGQDNVPGGDVALTLFWEATAPIARAYSVSTQVIDRTDNYKAGQRDGEPGCNLYPTTVWAPGGVIIDRYFINLDAHARPGTYTLLIGLYDRADGARPMITTADGTSLGDTIGLDEIRIATP